MAISYFTILEVSSNATSDEIHSAYRRLAKIYHPDHYGGGGERFRKIQEAYAVLRDPLTRREYKKTLENMPVRRTLSPGSATGAEPLIPKSESIPRGKMSPVRPFEPFSFLFDELHDWSLDNFSALNQLKSERDQNLTIEVRLTRSQAMRGGHVNILVPVRIVCPACRGYGHIGHYICRHCAGEGTVFIEVPISVSFPPGVSNNHSVRIPLHHLGIGNLSLSMHFCLRDAV